MGTTIIYIRANAHIPKDYIDSELSERVVSSRKINRSTTNQLSRIYCQKFVKIN